MKSTVTLNNYAEVIFRSGNTIRIRCKRVETRYLDGDLMEISWEECLDQPVWLDLRQIDAIVFVDGTMVMPPLDSKE